MTNQEMQLNKIGKSEVRLTKMNTINEYKGIIEVIRFKAGDMSIAEWELKEWDRKINNL